jgi:hypothetical protein
VNHRCPDTHEHAKYRLTAAIRLLRLLQRSSLES